MNLLNWVKDIPDYISYFDEDHQRIIALIGIDNYLALYSCFAKTGLYLSSENYIGDRGSYDRQQAINLIGDDNYNLLYDYYGKTGIYFNKSTVIQLKKAWVKHFKEVNYYIASRTLDVSIMSIYRWRSEPK